MWRRLSIYQQETSRSAPIAGLQRCLNGSFTRSRHGNSLAFDIKSHIAFEGMCESELLEPDPMQQGGPEDTSMQQMSQRPGECWS